MMRRAGPSRSQIWVPRLHRWLGLGSLVFVLLLSATGIALNHSTGWTLDRRYVGAEWLLRWYGIEAPAPSATYAADGHTVTLIGERLYFDERELAEGVAGLVGAVATPNHIAVATPTRILLVDAAGSLIEQLPLAALLPAEVGALGRAGAGLVFRSGDALFHADADVLDVVPWRPAAAAGGGVEWSTPSTPAPDQLDRLRRLYRGRGLTVERLLLDVHSGRVFSRAGAWLMDLVGAAFVVLSLLGLVLWLQRWRRRRPPG